MRARETACNWDGKAGPSDVEGATDDRARTRLHGALSRAAVPARSSRSMAATTVPSTTRSQRRISYTAYSIWDTFRAENSLLTLFAPERIDGMIMRCCRTIRKADGCRNGPTPRYTNIMIGTHADSLVAEAIRKGFHGFD